jgi:hypothetical protein
LISKRAPTAAETMTTKVNASVMKLELAPAVANTKIQTRVGTLKMRASTAATLDDLASSGGRQAVSVKFAVAYATVKLNSALQNRETLGTTYAASSGDPRRR